MSTKKGKIIRFIAIVVVIVVIVAGWMLWKTFDTSRSDVADDSVPLSQFKANDQAAIARGEYVMRAGDCGACHTAGHGDMAGGYDIETPFGSLYSSEIGRAHV